MNNVIPFTGDWYGDQDPIELLDKAKGWGAENVLILAYADNDVTGGSSMREMADILLLIEKFKHKLLSGGFATT